jgi:hypothetical protein
MVGGRGMGLPCWFVALQLQRRGQVEDPGETSSPEADSS